MFRKVIFIATLFVVAVPAFAQTTAAPAAKPITEFDVNGMKVIVKRRPSSPTVSVGLFIRGGVTNQKPENAGIESLALAVASEASAKYPREALRRELSRTGSSIGGGSGYDYGTLAMSSTRQHFDKTWQLYTDVVINPAFAQADFDQIRDRTITGLRNRGISPDDALNTFESSLLFAGHPYAIEPSGTIETIQKITMADAKTYYRSLLETSRLLLVVVGDIDPAVFQKQATASFGKLPKGNYVAKPVGKIAFTEPTLDVSQRSLPTNYVKGTFLAPSLSDPDYYAMRVAITMLQSRVNQEVRVKRNLSYAPNAEMDSNLANTANIYVTAVDANQAVTVMLTEIASMKAQAMDQSQYEGIPGYFLTTYYLQQETNSAQVAELAQYELLGGGWERSMQFLDNIRKVTPADVRTVANKYMKNLRFYVIGDTAAIDRPIFLRS